MIIKGSLLIEPPNYKAFLAQCACVVTYLYLLVLVVDERGSFSAVGAHIFPSCIKTVFEDIDWWWINDILWQSVPFVDYSVGEKWLPSCRSASWLKLFATRPVAATGFQTTAAYYTLRGYGLRRSQTYDAVWVHYCAHTLLIEVREHSICYLSFG